MPAELKLAPHLDGRVHGAPRPRLVGMYQPAPSMAAFAQVDRIGPAVPIGRGGVFAGDGRGVSQRPVCGCVEGALVYVRGLESRL